MMYFILYNCADSRKYCQISLYTKNQIKQTAFSQMDTLLDILIVQIQSQQYYRVYINYITNKPSKMLTKNLISRMYMFSKIRQTAKQAISGISNGHILLVGGFGICGVPMNLINAVKQSGVQNITCVSNNCGYAAKDTPDKDWGLAVLLRNKQIKRMISSYVGENPEFQRQYMSGELELQICPQGTLAQKIRSGGAGIPAFYTPTGVGTVIQYGGFPIKYKLNSKEIEIQSKPKPTAVYNGKKYVLQDTIFGDYALIKAQKADKSGNLVFSKTARNFNADMCTAAKYVIAEVEQIVEQGQIDPNDVHIPAVFVDRIFKSDPNCPFSEKKIQRLSLKSKQGDKKLSKAEENRLKIIKRAAKQVKDGMNVNLGIGIPILLPSVLPPGIKINLQSQNGIFGIDDYPELGQQDPDLINAGKETITAKKGSSYFSSSTSFGIIRGGHLDLTMLGSMEVSETGDIANWIIPGKLVKGMGGAMDLVSCGSKVIVVMQHTAKNSLKIFDKCRLPLTGKGVVSMVITELAVFQNQNGKLILTEISNDTTLQEVQSKTGFPLNISSKLNKF